MNATGAFGEEIQVRLVTSELELFVAEILVAHPQWTVWNLPKLLFTKVH
jgi:hypothetical protein